MTRAAIPSSLLSDHESRQQALLTLTHLVGETGALAQKLEQLVHAHGLRELEYALPPLGMLSRAVVGEVSLGELEEIAVDADQLQQDLASLLDEHDEIRALLAQLLVASTVEDRPAAAAVAHGLLHHLELEEQVLYPAALTLGRLARQRLGTLPNAELVSVRRR